jgi:hypothetical protein
MHSEISIFFNKLKEIKKTNLKFDNPVPIWIFDDFLPTNIFNTATKEINFISVWTEFSNDYSKSLRKECRNFTDAPLIESLAHSFNSNKTIKWIEELTGISGLIPDPHYLGGGLCRLSSQNKLDLHTDFPWNDRLRLNRKVNLILYMNERWDTEWGGDLEFWNNEKTRCVQKISPLPNRLALWIYEPNLIHGVPQALSCPYDVCRNNLILFYYTSNSSWETEPKRSNFNI